MRHLFLVVLAASAIATPAFAAGDAIVEAQIGYDTPSVDGSLGSTSGVSYGVTLAYELPIDDTIFFGAEVAVNNSTAKECAGGGTAVDPRVCFGAGRDFGAAARFGVDIAKNDSIYAIAGYSNLKANVTADAGTGPSGASTTLDGVQVGVGYRHWFGEKLFGKFEYRYSNYEAGVERHQGLVGVGYQF